MSWGQRKRFADGKVSLPYGQFLGYEKGEDGLPKIVEKEAVTVRKIYKMFLEGKTTVGIASRLTEEGILSPAGKKNWQTSTILSILQNEKYKGHAILQISIITVIQPKGTGNSVFRRVWRKFSREKVSLPASNQVAY